MEDIPKSNTMPSGRTSSPRSPSSAGAKSERRNRVRQGAAAENSRQRRSASGSRSTAISSPSAPNRSAIARACPPAPKVQSRKVSPGCGSSTSRSSAASTGSWWGGTYSSFAAAVAVPAPDARDGCPGAIAGRARAGRACARSALADRPPTFRAPVSTALVSRVPLPLRAISAPASLSGIDLPCVALGHLPHGLLGVRAVLGPVLGVPDLDVVAHPQEDACPGQPRVLDQVLGDADAARRVERLVVGRAKEVAAHLAPVLGKRVGAAEDLRREALV